MGAGSLINRDNLIEMIGSSAWCNSYLNSCYQSTVTFYIDAPAWQLQFNVWANSGHKEGSCFVSYWNGSSWIQVYGSTESLYGQQDYHQWSFKHNVDGGTAEDVHDMHLWKIVLDEDSGDGGSFYQVYSAGLEKVPALIYQSHFKGRKIIGVTCGIWEKGFDYATDDAFLADRGYGVLRGTPIAITSGTYLYICAGTS